MPGLRATIHALSGCAVHRKGGVHASPGELSHTAARAAGAGAGRHPAFRRRLAQLEREQQSLSLASR
jgi:hypothetical protein